MQLAPLELLIKGPGMIKIELIVQLCSEAHANKILVGDKAQVVPQRKRESFLKFHRTPPTPSM